MSERAERMDAIYARQRHFYDATRKYYLLGRDRLIAGLDLVAGDSVIEIGCGTARNLIAIARVWPEARLFGIDLSEAMLTTARANVARAGLSERIALAQGDATAFDARRLFGEDGFDRVVLSYTLSMIPDWRAAMAQAARVARGRVEIVDFGQQERLPAVFRRGLFAWLERFDVTPREDLARALDEIGAREALSPGFTSLHRGYAWAGRLERASTAAP
ncbi:methyltransferase [Sphingomonas sp. Leaf357]|uniref:class I SAM-dependent methyltransferase n=1 Tax=Sphingomonas sp. Leaf357 TaxID=1736350 RepID=UPI0006FC9395|nr:class I SAM-dependent methyltransferase [Sphingomonas sp. Leaf357]KQS04672.1 methyltransferase [Sphingomonas sp. Leaf357]